jgi:hypothetical protein
MSIALLMRIEALEKQVKALEAKLAERGTAAEAVPAARPVASQPKRR